MKPYLPLVLSIILLNACSDRGDDVAISPIGEQLGTVNFTVSGKKEAREHVRRGLQLLHHMTYGEADKEFSAALVVDPDCSMAYWGRAMAIVHPVWPDTPSESRLKQGWGYIEKARNRGNKRSWETDYIETLAVYFDKAWEREEKDRLADLDLAWEALQTKYPDDLEAASFYALFHLAPARFLPSDASYSIQRRSGLIVEDVLRRIPDHPGALHYQIHAYDFPALADRALDMCGLYSEVAPEVPHALHMPTHIYTRAGLWDKSVELNLRSAQAAQALDSQSGAGVGTAYLHALDYAVYAYLQKGAYAAADEIRREVFAKEGPHASENLIGGAFAYAAIPARCALEARRWETAAALEPRKPEWFPWDDRFAPQESIIVFARAYGATRAGDLELARKEIGSHKDLADRISARYPGTYWSSQAETQQLSLNAWLSLREGRKEEALELMRRAADLEASTEKEAVTPGEVLPAGEMLGEMLLEFERYEEAFAAFETSLERSANRFHSVYGAGIASEMSGDATSAARYYKLLVELSEDSEPAPSQLLHAQRFLDSI